MSAQVTISQLPAAGAITGTELVPVVQNGVTVQTTTAALAGSPVQTQTFLTKNQEPTLTNSRALSSGTGVGLVDGGAQSTLTITLNAASGSLESASTGMIAKTASNTVAARTMSSTTTGLSVTNGSGVAGNPTFALTGVALAVAGATGTGALALTSSSTVSTRTILGTASQIDVTDGNFVNSPVIAISADPVLSGTGGLVIPAGTTGQRGSSTNGNIRYNSTTGLFEGYNGAWTSFAAGSGVTSVATGTGLSGGPITSTGTISLADTAVVPASYTFSSITVDQQGRITAASSGTVPTGTVTSVAQSFTGGLITVSGSPVTTSGTLALSVAGTSGGIPYFSSSSIWASSAALTQYGVVYGGGAGATPVATAAGTTGQVLTATTSGAPSWASPATSGTVTSVSWTGGIISIANPTSAPAFTIAGTSGGIPYFSSGTTWATSGALTANAIVLGGGAGAAPAPLASLGTTTTVLHGNAAGAPTFGAVSLTADVTGTLAVANGGTNASTASITSFNNITGYTSSGATGTTSTNLVFSTSPTFTTSINSGATFTAFAGATTLLTIGGTGATSVVAVPGTLEQSGTTGAMTVAGGVYVAKILTAIGGISGGTF
jgi:trimeric autotransporter adhesin